MTFWQDLRKQVGERTTSADITMSLYKKMATSGVNMLGIIKPSFYMGQLSVLSFDYIGYVEKFLASEEGDWGEYLKCILYIREIAKRLLVNIQNAQGPLDLLVRQMEELREGENAPTEEEMEEEPEPEVLEKPDEKDLENILEGKEKEPESLMEPDISRDDLAQDYENLREELRVKIRNTGTPERVVEELSREIADVYQEAVQFSRELSRLSRCPDGDLHSLMSILVDIQFGLGHEMKKHLFEDILVAEQFEFCPGLLTWSSHLLESISEKVNREWHPEPEPEEDKEE